MTISIIIVNWNGLHHLKDCLPALSAQTVQPDEIIIVDNASQDGSLAYLKANYPEIELVELAENRGFSGGNIAGYEIATGDYIVLLNNDTKALPDWLEQLVRCADDHPEVGIVAALMTDWDGQRVDTAGDGCSVTGRGFKNHMNESTAQPLASGYVFSACAGAALYKRTMLAEVGFFDTRYFMNGEDTDLSFRAQLAGWRVFFCADSVVRHRISGSQGVYSDNAVYYSSRNHLWLYLKCMPASLLLKYSVSYLTHFFISLLFFAYRGQARAFLRGYRDALRRAREVWADRKTVQGAATVPAVAIEKQLTPLTKVIGVKLRSARPRNDHFAHSPHPQR